MLFAGDPNWVQAGCVNTPGVGLSGSVTRHPPCLTSPMVACVLFQTRCHPTSDRTPSRLELPQRRSERLVESPFSPYSRIREQRCCLIG